VRERRDGFFARGNASRKKKEGVFSVIATIKGERGERGKRNEDSRRELANCSYWNKRATLINSILRIGERKREKSMKRDGETIRLFRFEQRRIFHQTKGEKRVLVVFRGPKTSASSQQTGRKGGGKREEGRRAVSSAMTTFTKEGKEERV